MDFKTYILDLLLDKYEKSSHYLGTAKVNRKISLTFSPKNAPWYWESEKPYFKQAVHQVVEDLASQGILYYKWMPFEKGNLLDSVWLNLEKIALAYSEINRIPKEDQVKQVAEELERLLPKVTQEWIKNFLKDCLIQLQEKKDFPLLLPVAKEERELLMKTFLGLEAKKDAILLERIFSLKYLGHSKIFQREVKGRLARIAVQYLLESSELNEDEVLLELGIEKNSEEVLVWGPIRFLYEGKEIDYAVFPFGGVIDTKYLQEMQVHSIEVSKIITLENKANFHYLVQQGKAKDTLLIYLGGFPGPQKRALLKSLYNFNPEIAFYHWGDIDLGGFRIFETLKKVIPILKPLYMNEETLLKYKAYCDELEDSYAKQLAKLLNQKAYERFWPVIEVMLREKIRLEQEALLVEDNATFTHANSEA